MNGLLVFFRRVLPRSKELRVAGRDLAPGKAFDRLELRVTKDWSEFIVVSEAFIERFKSTYRVDFGHNGRGWFHHHRHGAMP